MHGFLQKFGDKITIDRVGWIFIEGFMTKKARKALICSFFVYFMTVSPTSWAMSSTEWEIVMRKTIDLLCTPVAKVVGFIGVMMLGLNIAFGGEPSTGSQRVFQFVFGLSITITAGVFLAMMLGLTRI